MRRKVISILLAASMLVGCGSATVFADDNADGKEPQVVTMTGWYSDRLMDETVALINEQLAGEYVLEYTYVALTDYSNVLSTQLASGAGPDIVTGGAEFPSRIKAGNVVDISDKEYLKDFNEAGFSLASEDGKIYGIPMYAWYNGIWYNEDILAECGVEVPTTFDEFLAACETIREAGHQPLLFGLADTNTFYSGLMAYLENEFYNNNPDNADGINFDAKFAAGEATLDGNINEYVKKYFELIERGFIVVEMLGMSEQEALNKFATGEGAFFFSGPWNYELIKEGGINFGLMPHLGEKETVAYTGGGPAANIGINVNAANKEGAEKVMEAFASVEVQQSIADANPGSPSYRNGVVVEIPEEYASILDTVKAGNIAVNWDRWSVNMPSEVVVNEGIALLQGVVSGDLTADEFVKALDAKADAVRYE